ncbi:MAG: histidinol dehydrogenase, partial [Thiohalocapsa sp.]
MPDIARLRTTDADFAARLDALLAWDSVSNPEVQRTVDDIIDAIRSRGDSALLEYTARFDRWQPGNAAALIIPAARLAQAAELIPVEQRDALAAAAQRIRAYAEHQKLQSWDYRESDGTLLGQKVTPLDRVGLYVPGGKAAYPSSVLMNAIPAKVAGVPELVMVVPTPEGKLNELVLAA